MTDLELSAGAWLEVLERDYLASYVREGGAAVKVAVTAPDRAAALAASIGRAGQRHGFVTAQVDQSVLRLYAMDRLFNAVAAQIDWDGLAVTFMRAALEAHGYQLPDGSSTAAEVARLNGVDPAQVWIRCEQILSRDVLHAYAMAKDFRFAMNQLCLAVVAGDDLQRETAERVKEWLRGELAGVGALRRAMIVEKINRYSARAMLNSAAEWIGMAGRSGLLVVVDVTRFATPGPWIGRDGIQTRPPSKIAVSDTYEMMRQCIDGTDEVSGMLLVFLSSPEFVTDERRGMKSYPALEMRLMDDVRDGSRANPFAPMVRITSA
ncbi:MAG TPA: BREX system ATP-binding domain-containing protein [Verrucomicrobiae bacterium]|nr:BREX system ATP-binding domain-containing protein [Verrucomicrobiae bacterium]